MSLGSLRLGVKHIVSDVSKIDKKNVNMSTCACVCCQQARYRHTHADRHRRQRKSTNVVSLIFSSAKHLVTKDDKIRLFSFASLYWMSGWEMDGWMN